MSLPRPLIVARSGGGVDATFTTFVAASYTPTADGTTPTTLTFTAKDATDTPIPNVSVTYA